MKKYFSIQRIALAGAVTCLFIAGAGQVQAQGLNQTISVDFNTSSNAAASQAALLTPGTWNEIVASTAGGTATLNLGTGVTSNVTLTYSATIVFDTINTLSANSPNPGLLRDYLLNNSATTARTVTLSGLAINQPYTLYLYAGADVDNRQTVFSINGITRTSTFTNNLTTFVDGGNYVSYAGVNSSATGTLVISYLGGVAGTDGKVEGDFNGLQLIVPEPSTWVMSGLGAGLLGLTLRRRRLAARA